MRVAGPAEGRMYDGMARIGIWPKAIFGAAGTCVAVGQWPAASRVGRTRWRCGLPKECTCPAGLLDELLARLRAESQGRGPAAGFASRLAMAERRSCQPQAGSGRLQAARTGASPRTAESVSAPASQYAWSACARCSTCTAPTRPTPAASQQPVQWLTGHARPRDARRACLIPLPVDCVGRLIACLGCRSCKQTRPGTRAISQNGRRYAVCCLASVHRVRPHGIRYAGRASTPAAIRAAASCSAAMHYAHAARCTTPCRLPGRRLVRFRSARRDRGREDGSDLLRRRRSVVRFRWVHSDWTALTPDPSGVMLAD